VHMHTRLVHPQGARDPFGASVVPVYHTATYDQQTPLEFGTYDYARGGNPTREALENQLAAIEGATRALAYPSGVAALDAIATVLAPVDEVLASADLYGGTFRLFTQVWSKRGIVVRYVDMQSPELLAREISPRTRLLHAEPLGNPMQTVCDIASLAQIARSAGILLSVDNTSLTGLNLRALDLGAHIVMHSATKFLNGHSDVTAGVLAVKDDALAKQLAFHHNAQGVALPPFESFLLLRGMETMALRLERQQQSAARIAEFLASRALVKRAIFVGLPGHARRDVHAKQSRGDGSVVSFTTGSVETSRRVVEALTLFAIRVSFGSVSSSVSMPASMSHKSVPAELRERFAPPADLVRLSIGIEHVDDLLADLAQALEKRV
jgi:cysteine-S-conjugate beta-lyase